ncbi:hypothetical protein [Neisseria sp. CCUG12390]|uniref:hypothetical protein n=1 Tax=Neisseria sp. CCUG12390 TaxID=3392035 RepID=UPI003A0FC6F1
MAAKNELPPIFEQVDNLYQKTVQTGFCKKYAYFLQHAVGCALGEYGLVFEVWCIFGHKKTAPFSVGGVSNFWGYSSFFSNSLV